MLQAAGKTKQKEVKQGMQEGHESDQKPSTLRRQRTADRKCQTKSANHPGNLEKILDNLVSILEITNCHFENQ